MADPIATPSMGSAGSRADAFLAKVAASEPVGESPAPVDEGGEAPGSETEVPTRPDRPRPKVAPLGGKRSAPVAEQDDGDGEAEEEAGDAQEGSAPDFDRIIALERDVVRKSRQAAAQQRQFAQQMQQLQHEAHKLQQERAAFSEQQKRFSDPAAVLEFFEQSGAAPTSLAEYILSANDPTKKAALEAKKLIDPTTKELAELKAEMQAIREEKAQLAAVAKFTGRVAELAESEHAASLPHVASMHEHDPEYLIEQADVVASELAQKTDGYGRPLQFGYDDVIVELEKRFKRFANRFRTPQTRGSAVEPADIEDETLETALPTRARAPAKKTSLTQRAASGRTTVVPANSSSDLAKIPMKSRVELAERRRMGR